MVPQKRGILKHLFLVLSPTLAYAGMNFIFTILFASESTLELHAFAFDAMFCMIILFPFYKWFSHCHKQDSEISQHSILERSMLLKIPILALGMGGLSYLWFIIISLYLESVPMISNSLESFDETWSTIYQEPYICILLSVVVLGPILEELIFRGIMFHYLEQIKQGWFPILISAVLFGLLHIEPVQVVYAILSGVILGILYAKTRDLRVTITIHVLNNFLSALPPFLDIPLIQNTIFLLSLIMIIPTIYIIVRMTRRNHSEI